MRSIIKWRGKFRGSDYLKDDLFYSEETAAYDGGIELAARNYKKNPDSSITIKGHTILIY
jgi:hypothetical protein